MKKGTVPIFLRLAQIIFVVLVIINFVLPLRSDRSAGFNVFNFIIVILWVYALLSSLGFVKKIAKQDEDGVIEYDTTIPIAPVGIFRAVEFGYYMLFKHNVFLYKDFIILVILDITYLILLLIDKSSYCYESCPGEEE